MPLKNISEQPIDNLQQNWLKELKQTITPASKIDRQLQQKITAHINTCALALDHFYSSSLFFLLDSTTTEYLFVSRSAQTVLGYNRDEIIANGFQWLFTLLTPDELIYKQAVVQDIFSFLKTLGRSKMMLATVKYDIVCQRKDGRMIHLMEELKFPEVSADGDPLIISCFLHNMGDYSTSTIRHCNIYLQDEDGLQTISSKTYRVGKDKKCNLSKRELQVLEQLSNGINAGQAAKNLFVSEDTVKSHRKNILLKLGVRNTAEAVKLCIRNNWL